MDEAFPVNAQRLLNVDMCWSNVVTSVDVILTLNQRDMNFDSKLMSTLQQRSKGINVEKTN